MKTNIRLSSMW